MGSAWAATAFAAALGPSALDPTGRPADLDLSEACRLPLASPFGPPPDCPGALEPVSGPLPPPPADARSSRDRLTAESLSDRAEALPGGDMRLDTWPAAF